MIDTLLRTKLYLPPLRPNLVPRPHLIQQLNQGLGQGGKLTLISAPAGSGKSTLISEWLAGCQRPAAWLSLDEGDSDPARFLAYLVAALQTIAAPHTPAGSFGEGILAMLQSPQPPPIDAILTTLLNEITHIPDSFILVLDDYHQLDAAPVDNALTFLLQHLPPGMHLVITTREDPNLPLARLRARGQLTELRAADLRFTHDETAAFLNQLMGLGLSAAHIAALETRTEGWIAGLQLAALSMRGHKDAASFIESFTGSHHFVMDYLLEEVLHQQPAEVQAFLLRTSLLDRLCAPLCDALLPNHAAPAQETLEYLAQANLFIIPLDNQRRWYRYHHLFADLLRQRLRQQQPDADAELHRRASAWCEENGLEIEAFHHAAAANDVDRAARLVEGQGMPLHFRGAMAPVLNWLGTLPTTELDARPALWVIYASVLTFTGQAAEAEQKLHAAETALGDTPSDSQARDLIGRIAAIRAMLAVPHVQVETMLAQSRRALEYLHPDNLSVRTATTWTLGLAYQIMGDRAAASHAYAEAIPISQASGNIMITLAATTCLGQLQELENQLHQAAESFRQVLRLVGDPPWPTACEAYLGLARVLYQWNDIDAAQQHGQQAAQLARQLDNVDTPAGCGLLLARLKLARGDTAGAAAELAQVEQFVRQRGYLQHLPALVSMQVLTLIRQGDLTAAARLAQGQGDAASQARVCLAQGDAAAALALLQPLSQQAGASAALDEQLKLAVLQAVAHQAHGDEDQALQLLTDALRLAQPGGFIRIFIDEGPPMAQLLSQAAAQGIMPGHTAALLAAFAPEPPDTPEKASSPLVEPLSQREMEVLQLIVQGLSNQQISQQLFLALSTVKGHNRNIFGKLGVKRRTEAVARARELGLL